MGVVAFLAASANGWYDKKAMEVSGEGTGPAPTVLLVQVPLFWRGSRVALRFRIAGVSPAAAAAAMEEVALAALYCTDCGFARGSMARLGTGTSRAASMLICWAVVRVARSEIMAAERMLATCGSN